MADWEKSHPKDGEKKGDASFNLNSPLSPVNGQTVLATGGTKATDEKTGLGGKGGSSVKNITMNVTFNNNFRVAGGADIREITDKVKREILAVMTDTVPAIG